MKPLYFDVSDVVKFAISNPQVSGIQRVQLNLIAQMSTQHAGHQIQCIFHHPRNKQIFAFDPRGVIDGSFDTGRLLRKLGIIDTDSRLPEPWAIKRALRPYEKRKVLRALHKIAIYITARVAPGRLARRGLTPPSRDEISLKPVSLVPMPAVPCDAALVLIGANWGMPAIEALAKDHAHRGGQLVQLIYDLIPVVAPQYFSARLHRDFKGWLDRISAYTVRYICISEWTASDLRRYLGDRATGAEVKAIPLAHEMHGFSRTDLVRSSNATLSQLASTPYVLCVGTIEIRKNGMALLDAWAALHPVLGDRLPRLIFAGRMGWLIDEFNERLASTPGLARTVSLVESPSDKDLAFLYQNCLFTAYPSLYEGWGLPVGESAWFGKYCISSSSSSLPEVCGDLIDYVDPADPEALKAMLLRAITQPGYVAERQQRIAQALLRTWADVAEDLYQCVCEDKPSLESA